MCQQDPQNNFLVEKKTQGSNGAVTEHYLLVEFTETQMTGTSISQSDCFGSNAWLRGNSI